MIDAHDVGRRHCQNVIDVLFDEAGIVGEDIVLRKLTAKNSQTFVWLSLLVTSHHRTGQTQKRDERLKQLEEVARTDAKALYALAENYAELGRTDDALAALEKCVEVREERMMWLKVEPRLASLKGNARFADLLRKMNLASNTDGSAAGATRR